MAEPFTVLVTGASRGLGLAFARAYAEAGWSVIATHRAGGETEQLIALARAQPVVELAPLDVCDPATVAALVRRLDGRPIDLLLNNAGVNGPAVATGDAAGQEFGTIDYPAWLRVFDANVLGPMRVSEALIDNVVASRRKQLVVVSSTLGAIARSRGGKYAYRTSKAAVNMLVKGLAVDLAARGVTTAAFCPGWVQTRMGGPEAPLSPEAAVAGVSAAIDRLRPDHSGGFWNEHGEPLPW